MRPRTVALPAPNLTQAFSGPSADFERTVGHIPGGGVYCTSFGGGDEGLEVVDDAQRWKMLDAGGKSCPDL